MLSSFFAPILVALPMAAAPPPGLAPQTPDGASGPTLAELTVDIWPEYDDPRVLVIYDGMLAPDAELPAELSFVVPGDAQVHMAGGIAANGGHIHADFDTREREDGMLEVSYTLEVPHAYMEFYYDPLDGAADRRFTYPVLAPFDIDSLIVRVQEPARSTGFALEPAPVDSMKDRRGLQYRIVRSAGIPGGAVTPVAIAYSKPDRRPSVEPAAQAQAAQGASQAAASSSEPSAGPSWRTIWALTLATLALGFFGVGVYKIFTTEPSAPRSRRGTAGAGAGGGGAAATGRSGDRFCTECGHPAAPDHRFCGRCGSSLESAAGGGSQRRR